ncbi:MAG: hypothetical protein ACTS27_00155 [Phycisphaerales bacterium]
MKYSKSEVDLPAVLQSAWREAEVLAVLPTFLTQQDSFASLFPNATIFSYSIVPHPNCLPCVENRQSTIASFRPPLLGSHLELVRQYWGHSDPWPTWQWLDDEFRTLHHAGYNFTVGDNLEYEQVILLASGEFRQRMSVFLQEHRDAAVAVYGRGHWHMNVAAAVASEYGRKLYVIERGLLPDSYIVDFEVPFTASGSSFRADWSMFQARMIETAPSPRPAQGSYWDKYCEKEPVSAASADPDRIDCLIVGQCGFDYNLRRAPFAGSLGFVDYVFGRLPHLADKRVVFRPHPLSPESPRSSSIAVRGRTIEVDRSNPSAAIRSTKSLVTWNSLLGLEALLWSRAKVTVLDPKCFYANLLNENDEQVRFVSFLKWRSLIVSNESTTHAPAIPFARI